MQIIFDKNFKEANLPLYGDLAVNLYNMSEAAISLFPQQSTLISTGLRIDCRKFTIPALRVVIISKRLELAGVEVVGAIKFNSSGEIHIKLKNTNSVNTYTRDVYIDKHEKIGELYFSKLLPFSYEEEK